MDARLCVCPITRTQRIAISCMVCVVFSYKYTVSLIWAYAKLLNRPIYMCVYCINCIVMCKPRSLVKRKISPISVSLGVAASLRCISNWQFSITLRSLGFCVSLVYLANSTNGDHHLPRVFRTLTLPESAYIERTALWKLSPKISRPVSLPHDRSLGLFPTNLLWARTVLRSTTGRALPC